MSSLANFFFDLLFPFAFPLSAQQLAGENTKRDTENGKCKILLDAIPDESAADLTVYFAECSKLEDAEDDRKKGVESRLTSILGLSSIAGTIVFSGILALVVGTTQAPTRPIGIGMALGTLYLALQLCSAILASVRGLERQVYYAALTSDVIPAPGEVQGVYTKRQISDTVNRLGYNRMRNNEKVSQMATAHRAIKNFIGALILIAVVGGFIAAATKPTGNNLVRTLKDNHELSELLRGPQGPKGDPGPPGPKRESSIARSTRTKPLTKTVCPPSP